MKVVVPEGLSSSYILPMSGELMSYVYSCWNTVHSRWKRVDKRRIGKDGFSECIQVIEFTCSY